MRIGEASVTSKQELWDSRRPDLVQAYEDDLILRGVKIASRKRLAQARKRKYRRKHGHKRK
jgi:hypothetical protein